MSADKFTLEIEIAGDAMRTSENVADALAKVADLIRPWGILFPGGRKILDENGNSVGSWEFE